MPKRHDTYTMLTHEDALLQRGCRAIAGIDEVGRGPLAGPVVVACVMMPLEHDAIIQGVNDSKKLSEKTRERLYDAIMERAIAVQIESADEKEIDRVNILQATIGCMCRAADNLSVAPDMVLVDAVKLQCTRPTYAIVHGDAISYSIACASIVAKVTRDRMMREYDALYPQYGFASNKGYGSAAHIQALRTYGKCPIHRDSFLHKILADV